MQFAEACGILGVKRKKVDKNEEMLKMAVNVIYDDQPSFWSPAVITVYYPVLGSFVNLPRITDDSGTVYTGSISTLIDLQLGFPPLIPGTFSYSWGGVTHGFQYLTLSKYLKFQLYGLNDMLGTFLLQLTDDLGQTVEYRFPDDWAGWKEVNVPLTSFPNSTNFDFTNVGSITLLTNSIPGIEGLIYLDYMTTAAIDPGVPSYTTGSGQKAPILLISPEIAWTQYNIPIVYAHQCPNCKSPLHQALMWNSFNSYRYLDCPVCGRFIEYMDNTGKLTNFTFVVSEKRTPLDEDKDVWNRY